MLKLIVVGIVATLTSATPLTRHPVNADIVAEIRAKAATWTPMDPSENPLSKKSLEEIQGLVGLELRPRPEGSIHKRTPVKADLPKSFDSRTQWPSCIHEIRDQ